VQEFQLVAVVLVSLRGVGQRVAKPFSRMLGSRRNFRLLSRFLGQVPLKREQFTCLE
jgi:hypothetical protein